MAKNTRRRRGSRSIRTPLAAEKWLKDELIDLVDRVSSSLIWHMGASYRRNQSNIVGDVSPQVDIENTIRKVVRAWEIRLDEEADRIAEGFTRKIDTHTRRGIEKAFKDSGVTGVKLRNSRKFNTIYKATTEQNASLIRNLGGEMLSNAQSVIWRGVQNGRDLQSIRDGLIEEAGIEARRAARIATDQANKATQALAEQRAQDIGITRAIWQHNTGGSKTYRESHIEFDGEEYDINEGIYDPEVGYNVKPAELPFCKCSFRIVIPGVDDSKREEK